MSTVRVRPAVPADLEGIVRVEEACWEKIGTESMASAATIGSRIMLCNSSPPGWFWVAEAGEEIVGSFVLQPSRMPPEDCTGWAMATDNGLLARTLDPDGRYVYGVSLSVPANSPPGTSDLLVHAAHALRLATGKKILYACARMPGFQEANRTTGVTAEEYWSLKRPDGTPRDPFLWLFETMIGFRPVRLLPGGYPPDSESGGHGVLMQSTEPLKDLLANAGRLRDINPNRNQKRSPAMKVYRHDDPKVAALQNGVRTWWDVSENRTVKALTLYLAQGCPDWGEKMRPPHQLCTFCALPTAARRYREAFFEGRQLRPEEHLGMLRANLEHLAPESAGIHTLQVFNAGSFFAEAANPAEVQIAIAGMVAEHPTLRRLVIESRAELISLPALRRITSILHPAGKALSVRIGVETQNDLLRLKKLRKGHTRGQLVSAVAAMKEEGVVSGGYVLLNPAPGLDAEWAIQEAGRTIEWILGHEEDGLAMDEVFFGATCVAPDTPLAAEWSAGRFRPATLWATWLVLRRATERYGRRVHMLPFKDEPPFLAVPSNHVRAGIPESLEGAQGCDLEFHALLQLYRETMEPDVLASPPECACHPAWAR